MSGPLAPEAVGCLGQYFFGFCVLMTAWRLSRSAWWMFAKSLRNNRLHHKFLPFAVAITLAELLTRR